MFLKLNLIERNTDKSGHWSLIPPPTSHPHRNLLCVLRQVPFSPLWAPISPSEKWSSRSCQAGWQGRLAELASVWLMGVNTAL